MNPRSHENLVPALRGFPVALAYLFGSVARRQDTAQSDIDIAVVLDEGLLKEERFDVRLKLMGAIERMVKKPVDVVVLNDTASIFLQYVVIKEGELLYQRSEDERLDFEVKLLGRYFDYQPFLEEYNAHYVATHAQ